MSYLNGVLGIMKFITDFFLFLCVCFLPSYPFFNLHYLTINPMTSWEITKAKNTEDYKKNGYREALINGNLTNIRVLIKDLNKNRLQLNM